MALLVLTSGCLSQITSESSNTGTEPTVELESTETASVNFLTVKDGTTTADITVEVNVGTNAFDAMLEAFGAENIVYKEYIGIGAFVTAINGVAIDAENYWALQVNAEHAQQGISAYTIEDDLEFKWTYTLLSDYEGTVESTDDVAEGGDGTTGDTGDGTTE